MPPLWRNLVIKETIKSTFSVFLSPYSACWNADSISLLFILVKRALSCNYCTQRFLSVVCLISAFIPTHNSRLHHLTFPVFWCPFFSFTMFHCFLKTILFSISSSLQSDLMLYWIFCANAQVSIDNIRFQCTLLVLALLNKLLFLRADNSIKFKTIITNYLWMMFCKSFLEM